MCQYTFKCGIDCSPILEFRVTCGGLSSSYTHTFMPGNWTNMSNQVVNLNGVFCTCNNNTCIFEVFHNGILVWRHAPTPPLIYNQICCIPMGPNPPGNCTPNNCAEIVWNCATKEIMLRKPVNCP